MAKPTEIQLYIAPLNAPFSGLEILIIEEEEGGKRNEIRIVSEPSDKSFYSVYVRYANGTSFCIADCPTLKQAKDLVTLMINTSQNFHPVFRNPVTPLAVYTYPEISN